MKGYRTQLLSGFKTYVHITWPCCFHMPNVSHREPNFLVRWKYMYLPKIKCVYSRYEQCLNNGNIIFVQNANHCFLSVKQPTCSVDGGGFSVFVVVVLVGLFSLSPRRGHFFSFYVFRSWGDRESILKHYKHPIFSLRTKLTGGIISSVFFPFALEPWH